MDLPIDTSPLGLKADGTPRQRRPGAGRPRLPTDEERRKRILESKRRWWRLNRGGDRSEPMSPQRILHEGVNGRSAINVLHPVMAASYGTARPFVLLSNGDLNRACRGEALPLRISSDTEKEIALFLVLDLPDDAFQTLLECTRNAWEYLAADFKRLRKFDPQAPDRWPDRKRFDELTSGLALLRSECVRRGLPAKWLMGLALQMRCTEDAKPCNSGQADAAQFVENQ